MNDSNEINDPPKVGRKPRKKTVKSTVEQPKDTDPVIPKPKTTRKKKSTVDTEVKEIITEANETPSPPKAKKRATKSTKSSAKNVVDTVANIDKDIEQNAVNTLENNVDKESPGQIAKKTSHFILHLPIRSSMLYQQGGINAPAPYDLNNTNVLLPESVTQYKATVKEIENPDIIPGEQSEKKIKNDSIQYILPDFIDANNRKSWPTRTNIHCWWCSLKFDTPPISLPIKCVKNTFHVMGCFCSYNCAMAYNMKNSEKSAWERSSLLHLLMKKDLGVSKTIVSAPPKEIMSIYGGTVSIKEYKKNLINNNTSYNILLPPLVSIIPQIETMANNQNTEEYIPVNDLRVKKATQSLRLARNKPLPNKNTLEFCMGLTSK